MNISRSRALISTGVFAIILIILLVIIVLFGLIIQVKYNGFSNLFQQSTPNQTTNIGIPQTTPGIVTVNGSFSMSNAYGYCPCMPAYVLFTSQSNGQQFKAPVDSFSLFSISLPNEQRYKISTHATGYGWPFLCSPAQVQPNGTQYLVINTTSSSLEDDVTC